MEKDGFNRNSSVEEFKEKYWYKIDLQRICHNLGLPTYGTKYELTQYICQYLSGKNISEIKPNRKRRKDVNLCAKDITLETRILSSGFRLNKEARKFFCKYYNVEKFSFNKAMGIKMREIERTQNGNATVKDLIDAYENTNKFKANEESTYQWNNFVKDFNADPLSKEYISRMKVAAILWQKIKESSKDKKYSRKLLLDSQNDIKVYLKNE